MMAFSSQKNTLTMVIVRRKRYLVDQLPRLEFYFWRQGKYLWQLLVAEKKKKKTKKTKQNKTLTTALVRRKLYLVIQLPHMKLNLRWQLLRTYDRVLLLKISVSDDLFSNIVSPMRLLPTDVDDFLPSVTRIYDGFLCFCDKLWPSQISLFFL